MSTADAKTEDGFLGVGQGKGISAEVQFSSPLRWAYGLIPV